MRKIITQLALAIGCLTQASAQAPTNGLVAYYPFNGNADNAILGQYNGVVTGASLSSDRNGNPNAAYSFGGNTTDQISFGDVTAFNGTSQHTICMWLNQSQLNVTAGIFHKSLNVGGLYDNFIQARTYSDGKFYGYQRAPSVSGFAEFVCNGTYSANTWFHVAIVFDGSASTQAAGYKTYINGQQISLMFSGSPSTVNPNLAGGSLIFGQANAGYYGGNGWNGKIDDIYLYNRALSSSEINDVRNATGINPQNPALQIARYSFNNGNANDEVGTNNGVATGATLTTDRFGNIDKAYSFRGNTTDNINVGDLTPLNNCSAYSMSMWLKQSQLDVIGGLWHKTKVTSPTRTDFIQARTYNDGMLYAYNASLFDPTILQGNVSLSQFDCSSNFTANTWFHYVAIYDGTQSDNTNRYKTYINGQFVSLGFQSAAFPRTTPDLTGGSLVFGQANAAYYGGNGWNGAIDDINIYTGVLTAIQVDSLFRLSNPVLGMNNLEELGVRVYPNPTNGQINIDAAEKLEMIEVFDMMGHTMLVSPSADNSQLDITSLTNGMYILKARLTDGRTGYTRIMKH